MSKSFSQEVKEILSAKGINPIESKDWVKNMPYNSIGLDDWCFPCVCEVIFLEDKNGRPLILSEGLRILSEYKYTKLYPMTPKVTLAMQNACNEVYENWQKAVAKQMERVKSA